MRTGASTTPRLALVDHQHRPSARATRAEAGWRPTSRASRREQRRRRLAGLLRLVVFLALVFLAAWAGVRVAHAGTEADVQGERYVTVAGDSLWQIAVEHYGADVDVRRAVHEIRVANGLASAQVLQPGDELILPVAGDWRAVAAFTGQ